ncbi:MAG: glutamate 5-kinase [Desulfuromonadales bacterium]|nr:glutamate 5-kinase [Desulfuromonadales bacterium]
MRDKILKNVKRIVIKIGSRVLTGNKHDLDKSFIESLARQTAELRKKVIEVIIVTSGAVAAGKEALKLSGQPKTIPQKQAAAAIGQSLLMRQYEDAFDKYNIQIAQVLLTHTDLSDRTRYLNAGATLSTLLDHNIIPVINENDTVVVDEIKFGDNDNLSAQVTNLVNANLLVILTDIDGLFDSDPHLNPKAKLIPFVKEISEEMEQAAGGTTSTTGTGGMVTKLAAAKKAGRSGAATLIVNGFKKDILLEVLNGAEKGTFFLPQESSLTSRKHWIAFTLKSQGKIFVDPGAGGMLRKNGKSLLPSGIASVEGNFDRGACVTIIDNDGMKFAKGIVDYSSQEIDLLKGRKSSEIEDILGYRYSDEIIHRDNLVLL